MPSALEINAMTNFVLAAEAFFVSGLLCAKPKKTGSAAWYWQFVLLVLAVSALLGGIDHGFFEVHGQTFVRKVIAHSNWFLIGLLTFLTFRCTAQQFFSSRWQKFACLTALIQLVVYTFLILKMDDYLVVILNYVPVLLLLLVCNVICLRRGGSWAMTLGILLTFFASGIQAFGFDMFQPVDHDSLYHILIMAAVFFFYRAGLGLKGD